MSDDLRKDFSDKVKETITPDSSKSTGQKAKEAVTSGADKFAGEAQTDDQKGFAQQAVDSVKKAFN